MTGLKCGVNIIKKAVFHVDNLDANCTEETLVAYLKDNNIDVLSCFTSKSWIRDNDKEKVSAFRICVPAAQRQNMLDSEIWPAGVVIRDWKFKGSKTSDNGGQSSY